MENTSKIASREVYYFRRRYLNRVFSKIAAYFAEEAQRTGVTKAKIAARLDRDPAQISRWLSSPTNLTLETISDLLLGMGAEPEPPEIIKFGERPKPNFMHPWLLEAMGGDTPAALTQGSPAPTGYAATTSAVTTTKTHTLTLVSAN